jgi:hypothetical protein
MQVHSASLELPTMLSILKMGSDIGISYQLPILTMVNMIAGILGSLDGAVLMRPQP